MLRKGIVSLCGLMVCLAVSSVHAGIVGSATANYTGNYTDGTLTIYGVANLTTVGGFYLQNKTGGTGDGVYPPNGTVYSVCVDLFQYVAPGSHTYDVRPTDEAPQPGSGMGVAKATLLAELWGRYFSTAVTSGQKAEAFSAAVWEIVNESDALLSVSVGTGFYCTGLATGMDTLANGWLASLDGTGPMADLRAWTSPSYQDFVVQIPEPASAALITLGGLAALVRRRTAR